MRNFDFKRYTPRPKKLLRASLKGFIRILALHFRLYAITEKRAEKVRSRQQFNTKEIGTNSFVSC